MVKETIITTLNENLCSFAIDTLKTNTDVLNSTSALLPAKSSEPKAPGLEKKTDTSVRC